MILGSSVRALLCTLLAALTQLSASPALTTAAVLAVLLVVLAATRRPALVLLDRPAPWLARGLEDRHPALRLSVVAGRGRPQPRAPGARSRAGS